MAQFRVWDRGLAAWSNAAQSSQSQLRQFVADLAARGEEVTNEIRARAADGVARTRSRCEQIPNAMVDELRRRTNVLDLATRHDVEIQSKLARSRLSYLLKEFLEAQRTHDEELHRSLRSEFREELEGFAAAISDDLFAIEEPAPRRGESRILEPDRGRGAGVDSEEIDLVSYDEIRLSDDEDVDLTTGRVAMRRSMLDTADE